MSWSVSVPEPCSHCQSEEIYHMQEDGGMYCGPRLLRGLSKFLKQAVLDTFLCADCSHVVTFADEETRARAKDQLWLRET